MGKYNKKFSSGLFIIAILTVVYSVIYWVVPIAVSVAKVLTYIFSLVSVGICVYSYFLAFVKSHDPKSAIYGFPISRIGFIYVIVQMVVSFLVLIISKFIHVKPWVCVLTCVSLFGVALIGVIITDNSRDYIQNLDVQKTDNTKAMKYFNADVTSIIEKCSDVEVKKALNKLAEECKYSDPVSNPETEILEDAINEMISDLAVGFMDMDKEDAIKKIEGIRDRLRDRNRKCKLSKGM